MSSFTEIQIYDLKDQKYNLIANVTIDIEPKYFSLANNVIGVAGGNTASFYTWQTNSESQLIIKSTFAS